MRNRKRMLPDVAITRNDNEILAISEGFQLLKAQDLITPEDIVVITPNWVNPKKPHPSQAVVVGQESLRSIIRFVKQQNPKRIVIATGSGSSQTSEVIKAVGYDKVIDEEQVEFIDLNYGPYIEINLNHDMPNKTSINKLLTEMTVLISFTQLKHHEEATMSAAIKNIALGWPPAEIHGHPKKNLGIHNNLHGFIRAMAENIPIDLSIISASPTMVGTGPTKGTSKHTGIVICGTDPVATDTIGARLLGFKPQGVNYLFQCANAGIGESTLENINISGMDIKVAEEEFSKIVFGDSIKVDE